MRMSHLRYFLEVSRTKNISLAAKNLHLSQPSLSFAIKTLEDELGIPLLIRHSHSVSLTEAGEQFASHAERIVGSADQLRDLMHRHSNLLAGNLRLGMLWIGGYMNLFSLLNGFKAIAPAVSYELVFDGSSVLMRKLLGRSLHGAFVISSPHVLEQYRDIHSVKLSEEEYMLLVPENNPLSSRPSVRMQDLHRQTIIMPSETTLLNRQLSLLFQENGITPHILCSTSQSDIIGQIVGEGLAVGFASSTIAKKICPENCRVAEFEPSEKIYRMIYFITLNELLDYPLTKAFSDFIETY